MSLFPSVDLNVATITQPQLSPKDKNMIFFGRRIIKSSAQFGKARYEFVKDKIRYIRRHRKYYLFWGLIGTLTCLLLYMTNAAIFKHDSYSSLNKRSSDLNVDYIDHLVVRRSPGLDDAFPSLPIQPPPHATERPLIAHYLWCGQRVFEFRHYLSVISVDRVIKPSQILFHYVDLPLIDTEKYFVWFNQSLKDIQDIKLNKLERKTCPSNGPDRFMLVLELLFQYGGVYIPDDVILLDYPHKLRTASFVSNVISKRPNDYKEGMVIAKANSFDLPSDSQQLHLRITAEDSLEPSMATCVDEYKFEKSNQGYMCLIVTKMIFPRDIWNSNSKFAMLSRILTYNKIHLQPDHDLAEPIPRVAHYVCVSGCKIEFITYISMLSSIFIAKLDRVYIHGPSEPIGQWWGKLKDQTSIVFVKHRDMNFESANIHSLTRDPCPLRVEILLQYGGIYLDGNILWTNQIPDYYFGYEAVVSPDWHLYGSWPESINPSILMGKKGSRYLIKLARSLKSNTDDPNWFNDHYSSYHIIEVDPESVFLDRRLQVKCLNHNCHPTWLQDYRSELHQNKPGSSFDWRSETLSVQWIDSLPTLNIDMVKYVSGIPEEIARKVFQAAEIDINTL